MSILDRIKTAIFGDRDTGAPSAPQRVPARMEAGALAHTAPSASSLPPVDIEMVMRTYEGKTQQKLNWRTSIVDLLKLLELDSSFENRKELAKELGYSGNTSDSATMNVWLHQQVMSTLQASGGRLPAALLG